MKDVDRKGTKELVFLFLNFLFSTHHFRDLAYLQDGNIHLSKYAYNMAFFSRYQYRSLVFIIVGHRFIDRLSR